MGLAIAIARAGWKKVTDGEEPLSDFKNRYFDENHRYFQLHVENVPPRFLGVASMHVLILNPDPSPVVSVHSLPLMNFLLIAITKFVHS